MTLVNIYAPNNDNPAFFQNLLCHILSFECEEVIVGGDFNLVLDVHKDKKGGNLTTHSNSLKEVQNMENLLDLIDVWRVFNPDTKRFTWRRTKPEIHSRLDFFLVSASLTPTIRNADILPGYKTDHSLITIHLANNNNPRGPGFWKLNTSFLLDDEYVDLIKKTIDNVANEYRNNVEVDAVLLWDTMKMQIRSSSLKYAKEKKAKIKSKEKTLELDISSLRKQLEEGNLSDTAKSDICKELDIKTLQFEKISQYHTRGAILRSKARWYNEGEKNSKYFLNLQKRHFNTKTIKQLKVDDNSVITTDDKILKEAKAFYQKLYTTNKEQNTPDHADIFFPEGFTEILDEQSQKECEGLLTDAECLESLKTMAPNKSPGTDGLPAEFYKIFWDGVKPFLINALNHGYAKGHLSITQKRGMITLVPKKNKPAILLKNWRPITLLNCGYKIAAKSIANRVKKVLPKIINNDQTGFLKNRAIGENIRLIDSIIKYTNTKQMPGLLLFIDFEKAFDSLEWSFIEKTLRYVNFGMSLVKWFKLFYTDISSCIQNNWWSSEFFSLSRGVRQGCPLSPYLFILCAEILANAVRKDKEIRGINIDDMECKLSQYADDTTMILDGSQLSFSRTLYLLDIFTDTSGLKVNYEKTEALWIGSYKDRAFTIPSSKPVTWAEGKVYALGVQFSNSEINESSINFCEKIEKMRKILSSWSAKKLTLLGKIAVLKSLVVSQIVYVLSSLPTPQGVIKEINSLFYEFLWSNKSDKIKRTEMIIIREG